MNNVIAINCHVLADGTVIPNPGFEGSRTEQGPFRGSCAFEWLPERGTEPHTIIAQRSRQPATSARAELIGVDYRDITYFWLEREEINGSFSSNFFFKPTVGGAYPSVLNYADYPSGAFLTGVDPSTVVTDGAYGWTVPDPTLDPYYLTNGASIWVDGDTNTGAFPGSAGYVALPAREVLAVGSVRHFAQTIGADNYTWDVCDVLVREYKYRNYTWAQWWAI